MNNPSQAAPDTGVGPLVRTAAPARIIQWLKFGWNDLRTAGVPSLMHGILVVFFSLVVVALTFLRWELVMIAASCFLFFGPFMATGLYAISRTLEEGGKPTLQDAVKAWRHAGKCLGRFGLLLVLVGVVWVIFSLAMFYFFVNVRIEDPLDFLRYVLTQHDMLFLLWSILGGLYAALAFAITVVTVPMLIDRDVNTWMAIRTSIRTVSENPYTMVAWAMVIMALTGAAFITGMLAFVVVYPIMGHASWHVYRDLLDTSQLPSHTA